MKLHFNWHQIHPITVFSSLPFISIQIFTLSIVWRKIWRKKMYLYEKELSINLACWVRLHAVVAWKKWQPMERGYIQNWLFPFQRRHKQTCTHTLSFPLSLKIDVCMPSKWRSQTKPSQKRKRAVIRRRMKSTNKQAM